MKSRVPFYLAVAVGLLSPATSTLRAAADPWEDRPLRINQKNESPFPPDLLANGVSEGEVHAVLMVDANGKLLDCLITAYTHPELARELLRQVRYWEYEPALERGVPVGQRLEMMFTFQSTGVILSQIPTSMIAAVMNRKFKAPLLRFACKPTELDRTPALLTSVSPSNPGKALRTPDGSAAIDFYIDAEGRPRMPVNMRSTHEAFAAAAIEALLQWRFEPPTSNGRPVAVRMVQEFIF